MTPKPITKNTLFYGDNLPILREHFADESVDLIYLDPPFNSNRSYNVLFKDESGEEAEAHLFSLHLGAPPNARVGKCPHYAKTCPESELHPRIGIIPQSHCHKCPNAV